MVRFKRCMAVLLTLLLLSAPMLSLFSCRMVKTSGEMDSPTVGEPRSEASTSGGESGASIGSEGSQSTEISQPTENTESTDSADATDSNGEINPLAPENASAPEADVELIPLAPGGDYTESGETDGEDSSSGITTRPQLVVDPDDAAIPVGYNVYNDFNTNEIGAFVANTYFSTSQKSFVTYNVVKDYKTLNDQDGGDYRSLLVSRKGADSSNNTDALVDMRPRKMTLQDVYAVSFSLKVTNNTKTDIVLSARKVFPKVVYNEFARYSPSTGLLTAAGKNVCKLEKNRWYDVALVIDDVNKVYDVYVDGIRRLREVDYANAAYPDRLIADVEYYRFTIPQGMSDTEFYLDNLAAYNPTDDGKPFRYVGDDSVAYERLELPDVTVFDAATADWDTLKNILGTANAEKINGYDGNTGGVDLSEAFRYVKVNETSGEYSELADYWGGALGSVDSSVGEAKYLMLDGFADGFTEAAFMFDYDLMVKNKIVARTGKEVKETIEETFGGADASYYYDLTNYSTLKIDFFVPAETYAHPSYYQFMLFLASGNRGGISYFTQDYKTNDVNFAGGFYSVQLNIASLSANRNASLTTLEGVQLKFAGWSNGLNGQRDDPIGAGPKDNEHPIAIKSITLCGSIKVPVEEPASGMEGCEHKDEAGNDLLLPNGDKSNIVMIPATCLDFGYSAVRCALCGKTSPIQRDADYIELPVGHSYYDSEGYNPGEIIIPPTCTEFGSVSAPCLNCGIKAMLEELAPTGHDFLLRESMDGSVLSWECKTCGAYEEIKLLDSLIPYGTVADALEAKGLAWRGADFDNDDRFTIGSGIIDSSYDISTARGGITVSSSNGLDITVRNTTMEVLDNGGVDNVKTFIRLHDTTVGVHNMLNINATTPRNPEKDFVFEYTYRLGKAVNGAYISYSTQLIDRNSEANSGQNLFYVVANHTAAGTVTFVNSNLVVSMSEEAFTQISLAFHLTENTYDIYINGRLMERNVVLNKNAAQNMALFSCDEIRFGGCQMGTTSWTDLGSCYVYSSRFPVAVLGLDSVYGITYHNLDGADNPNPQDCREMDLPLILKPASREDRVFAGWYSDAELTNKITRIDELSGNVVLWAKWENGTRIATADQLKSIALNGTYILDSDIDLGGAEWTPIGTAAEPFTGTFDGNGHKIYNFKITASTQYVGLFGYSTGAIHDLGVEEFTVDITSPGVCFAGGLVGINAGSLTGCYAVGGVNAVSESADCYAGGLAGRSLGAVTACYADCDVNASGSTVAAGGLLGDGQIGAITQSYALGNVCATSDEKEAYAGGLIGRGSGPVNGCYALGEVIANGGSGYAGGLIGYNAGGIANCYAEGNVSASSDGSVKAGGLVGSSSGEITVCYARGDVYAASDEAEGYAGGLVGFSGNEISFCFAEGTVTVTADTNGFAGGFVGLNKGKTVNSRADSVVTARSEGNAYAGGLIGFNSGAVSDCYASLGRVEVEAGGNGYAGGIAGFNGAEIKYCYSLLDVICRAYGNAFAGGLVGINSAGTVNKCYALGDLQISSDSGSVFAGGLVGMGGKVYSSYRSSEQVISVANGSAVISSLGGEEAASVMNTVDFQKNTMGFLDFCWLFAEGEHPELK